MAGQEKPKPQELEKWYFVKEQLQNSPSRKCGLDADKELAYRQQSANLIQDMGQRLQVSQLCINTAIVYMHRFYAFHSFTQFHRNAIAAAALFLAAKVEEQPRKLEYVIKVAHACLHRGDSLSSITNEHYQEQAQDLVFNENVLLQTLGFDVAIDHPHTHVVRTCHLVKAPKDLAQTSYFMASNSLHLTTMCLQYRPTVVACFCIHLASKWSNWAIPQSCEGRHWFSYVDNTVTSELLERLTAEFLHIFDKCPSRLKKKMKTMSGNSVSSPHSGVPHSSSQAQPVATTPFDKKHATDDFDKSFDREYEREKRRQPMPGGYVPAAVPAASAIPTPQKIDYNLYKEKREREERERRQQQARAGVPPRPGQPPQPHQRPASHHNKQPHHQWPHHAKPHHKPHDKVPHEKMPHDKVSHDKIPHDKIPHDKIQHEKIPHEKIPHDKIPHDHRHLRQQIPSTSSNSNPFQNPQPEVVQRTRPPSLFSPENVTTPSVAAAAPRRIPQKPPRPEQRPMPPSHPVQIPNSMHERQERPISPHKKRPDNASAVIKEMQQPMILSPFSSPPAVKEQPQRLPRQRLQSNSEPELVPVVKKLDETPGYENVIRDSQRGNIIKTRPLEPKREPPPRALNGIETDPTLVSNLLKESLAKPAPITVVTEKRSPLEREIKREPIPDIVPIPIPAQIEPGPIAPPPSTSEETSEHKHKKEKKKKEKHKHKDRDKSKEERKKHKKDKERDKKKEPTPQAPIEQQPAIDNLKITIPRDKLSNSPGGQGLKIKIPKERLAVPPPPPQQSGLKIKISKDILDSTRKRAAMPEPGPPQKMARQNGAHHSKMEAHLGNGHGK